MRRSIRGFTLVEILMCVAIITMLCALIFAALGPLREKARQRSCASNLHQWGVAFNLYAQDYDGIEPSVGTQMTHAQMGLPVDPVTFLHTYHLEQVCKCPSTHYAANDHRHPLISYDLQAWIGENQVSNYPSVVALRGPDLPLLICKMHNADVDFADQPTWATAWLQVLRINGSVQFENVNVHNSYLSD